MLGVNTGYIGKVGRDETGAFFRNDMVKSGINPALLEGNAPSGVAIALISKDSERTLPPTLGQPLKTSFQAILLPTCFAVINISTSKDIWAYKTKDLFVGAMELAKADGLKVTLRLGQLQRCGGQPQLPKGCG